MDDIKDFFKYYKDNAWAKDVDGMIDLYSDNTVIFDMWGKGSITGIKEWSGVIKDWLTSLNDEKVKVEFENVQIHESDAVGFASAIIQYQAISADNKVIRSMKNRITIGFVKRNNKWEANHQHTSAPIDSTLTAILDI